MKRYPGIRPFRTDEKGLFFGRDADIERLHRLIGLEQLIILYGKSGYGKSSLLSAGIFPRLEAEGKRQFLEIRFGPYKPGESLAPADANRQAFHRAETNPVNPVQKNAPGLLPNAEPSLWLTLKNRQQTDQNSFLLVFDQFEELFSYPAEQILEFKKQLAEALYSRVPKRYETALAGAGLAPEQEDIVYAPFDLKVVFSIRSDRMSLLNGLKDYLPNLLQHGYELEALDEAAATEAVCRPAALPEVGFDTPPFAYAPAALDAIFAALRNERGRIETSALQIVCRYVEDNVVGGWQLADDGRPLVVEAHDLGDIKSIFRQFYERTIENLPESERDPARRLVEDLLIKDGARIPYAAQALLATPGVSQSLLDHLAAASLLRVERDEQGRMLYEVGHDTLVAPISEAAQARRAEEEKIRLQQDADEQRREKEKAMAARRRARIVAIGAVLLSVIAIAASYLAYVKSEEAGAQAAIVLKKEKEVEANVRIAKDKSDEAAKYLKRAEEKEEEARLKNEEVQRQKDATEEQKRRAAIALQEAQAERRRAEEATVKVVQSLLADASDAILRLDYETARDRLHDAADLCTEKPFDNPLGRLRPAVADSLMEPAWFLAETGNAPGAQFEIGVLAQLLAVHDPADTMRLDTRTPEGERQARATLRKALRQLRPAAFDALETRYYPVLLPVSGGEFWMGCDSTVEENCGDDEKPRHRVRLKAYELAETETTNWQYALFATAHERSMTDKHYEAWGAMRGHDPVINVSWEDAVEYANWLSAQFNRTAAYQIDSIGRSQDDGWDVTRVPGANGFCLPTEAEWEYAARGGPKQTSFIYAGADRDALDEIAWWWGNSSRTNPVRTRRPNSAGFYDMSGNVLEWCWDWYAEGYYAESPGEDPIGPEEGGSRCLRGGSWFINDSNSRLAARYGHDPNDWYDNIGFRLARHL